MGNMSPGLQCTSTHTLTQYAGRLTCCWGGGMFIGMFMFMLFMLSMAPLGYWFMFMFSPGRLASCWARRRFAADACCWATMFDRMFCTVGCGRVCCCMLVKLGKQGRAIATLFSRQPNGGAGVPLSILNILPLHGFREPNGGVWVPFQFSTSWPLLILDGHKEGLGFPFQFSTSCPLKILDSQMEGFGFPFQFSPSRPLLNLDNQLEGLGSPSSTFNYFLPSCLSACEQQCGGVGVPLSYFFQSFPSCCVSNLFLAH